MNTSNESTYSHSDEHSRLIVRVAPHAISFLRPMREGAPVYLPYVSKGGMSVAANLRMAFKEENMLLKPCDKALLSVCSPVSLIPLDDYMADGFDAEVVYNHAFPNHEHDEKVCNVLPELNAVAVFSVNKDTKLVLTDRFENVRIQNIMQPVWEHLYHRSQLVSQRRKLYVYFHDGMMDVFSFHQRRFRFSNAFPAAYVDDIVYYLLVVWRQLGLDLNSDELHIVGNYSETDLLMEKLKTFLRRVYRINPSASLNRAPVTAIERLDFDMMIS